MSGLLRASSRCKYSWWWDSHITPKNSKWLQENLTDMDSKIKAIIKLIEEDADSFAMRAEMYYKKRPELMQLVEEFYRAYRALAERYDNATGVIRQAQRTMVEAFPNQDPLGITEDLLASHHFQKGLSLLGGGDTEQLAEDKVRKGLDFYEDLSVSEVVSIFENEIQVLKDALSQLEIEKEAGIVQYEDSLEKVSKLEKVSRELTDRANKAEEEAHVLRDSIATLEAEKEATLLEYQNCLVNIANLEKNLSQAKDEASKATCEKDEALGRYEHSLEMILDLEMKLKRAEENAMDLMEGADNAEREVEDLKKVLAKLTTERESNILRSIEAETNLQKLQNLHSETQDQMRLLALELEKNSNEMSRITEENKSLKDSYELLEMEKFYFTDEKDTLASQRETTQQAVKALGKRQEKLEEKQPGLEKELESNISKLEEIYFLLDTEKKRKSTSSQNNETQFAGMKVQICHLQEEVLFRTRAFEDELEKAMNYQFENLILRRCIEDLKENNPSLLIEDLSDKTKILDMEKETLIKELKIKNELWILSQNEANKLLELNRDLEKKVDKLASLNVSINRELEEANMITNNREYQIYKLAEENRELGVKLKKLKEELGLTTQLSDGEIYELQDRLTTKDAKIDLLEKKNGFLEGENGRLKSQLASYAPLVLSLKDSVSSLEYRTLCTKGQKHHNDGEKEVVSVNCKNGSADSKALDLNSELKDLQYKIKVIERTFIQKEKHAAKENSDTNTDLEIAKEGIDSLKLRTCTNREYSVPIYNKSDFKNEFTMKDIMLDKNSESSYELSRRLERKSRSKRVESWDSTDINHSIEFTTRKEKGLRSQNSKLGSSKIEAEKELGVDTLEISRTFSQRSQEATKTKIVERLNSDAQKLSNLQINVQDLLKKVEITEKGKKGKSVYKGDDDILIEQLEEAEEAIVKLFDYNGKLMRSVEKRSFSSNVNLGIDSEECASARRRKIAEQARKISEKVEKWQTKVQKIQTLMLETDKKETKGKLGVKETKKKVMLRDYLYGRLRTPSRELKKARSSFCVCVQPSTRGD